METKYAPVIIPTLCRVNHFKKCLKSLQDNLFACDTEVYISLDYPQKQEHHQGWIELKKILEEGIKGFKDVHIYYQTKNLGAYENYRFLIGEVYKRFETYIFTEDDNVFALCALEYFNCCLKEFKDRKEIFAICSKGGYSQNKEKDKNIYMLGQFSAYGYATWKHKEKKYATEISFDYFRHKNQERKNRRIVYKSGLLMLKAYTSILYRKESVYFDSRGDIALIDLVIALYMVLEGDFAIFPKEILVRNYGYDGTGENCAKWEEIIVDIPISQTKRFIITDKDKKPFLDSIKWKNDLKNIIHKRILYFELLLYNYIGISWYKIIKSIFKKKRGYNAK